MARERQTLGNKRRAGTIEASLRPAYALTLAVGLLASFLVWLDSGFLSLAPAGAATPAASTLRGTIPLPTGTRIDESTISLERDSLEIGSDLRFTVRYVRTLTEPPGIQTCAQPTRELDSDFPRVGDEADRSVLLMPVKAGSAASQARFHPNGFILASHEVVTDASYTPAANAPPCAESLTWTSSATAKLLPQVYDNSSPGQSSISSLTPQKYFLLPSEAFLTLSTGIEGRPFQTASEGDLPIITIGDHAQPPRPLSILALGDSYTSGEGLLPGKLSYECGTDLHKGTYLENSNIPSAPDSPQAPLLCDTVTKKSLNPTGADAADRRPVVYKNLCHRHMKAWPVQVGKRLGIPPADTLFEACSGAVAVNLGYLPPSIDKDGHDKNQKPQYPRSPEGVPGGKTQAADADLFFKSHRQPDLVTIGLGGNDAGFNDIITDCLLNECATGEKKASRTAKINSVVYPRLVSTFTEVRKRFPSGAVLAYGYPSVLKPDRPPCEGLRHEVQTYAMTVNGVEYTGNVPLYDVSQVEREWIENGLLPELNEAVEDAAAASGVTFMPTYQITKNHEICAKDAWINGLRLGDDIHGIGANESFHPNQKYHEAVARYFVAHYTDGKGHLTFSNPAPNTVIRKLAVPGQINLGSVALDLNSRCGPDCLALKCSPVQCGLNVTATNFEPNSRLRVTIHSDNVELGGITTDIDGTVEADLDIPGNVSDGFHIVDLSGIGPDGTEQQGSGFVQISRRAQARPTTPRSPIAAALRFPWFLAIGGIALVMSALLFLAYRRRGRRGGDLPS